MDRREFLKRLPLLGAALIPRSIQYIKDEDGHRRYGLIDSKHPLFPSKARVILNGHDITHMHVTAIHDIEGWIEHFEYDPIKDRIYLPPRTRRIYGYVYLIVEKS